MAKAERNEKDRVKKWTNRLTSASKVYGAWESEYECQELERYYKGHQHRGLSDAEAKKLYTINYVFPTIEIGIPSLLFERPKITVTPRPPHADDPGAGAPLRASLAQATLQTFIDDKTLHFSMTTELAMRDAEFRFGLVEVGYTPDWIDNPNADKPVLKDDNTPLMENDQPVVQPQQTLKSEQLYWKRIRPDTFRVSQSGANVLTHNDWVAYFEWTYVEDLKRNKKYDTKDLKATGRVEDGDAGDITKHSHMVKVWKVWDLRTKERHVIAEGHPTFLLEGETFKELPIADLKYYEIADSYYPLPPVFNWLSPQDELNETREMQKVHRQRFKRRYTMKNGAMDPPEVEKLESGPDGVVAFSNVDDPLRPVPDAPLDGAVWSQMAATKDDFMQISGVSGDQRGVPESTTATQANIVNMRSTLRESKKRIKVADWLSRIARLTLGVMVERMQLPIWVKVNADLMAAPDVQARIQNGYLQLKAEELQGCIDYDVAVDVTTMSPVTQEQQAIQWNALLALMSNMGLVLLLSSSDVLLRKTLAFYGVENDSDVQEIKKAMLSMMQMQMLLGAPGGGGKSAGSPMGAPSQPAAGVPAGVGA